MENTIGKNSAALVDADLDDEEFQREFLKGMDELGECTQGWRGQLPYDAILNWHDDARYENHVASCAYCQELLETLRAT